MIATYLLKSLLALFLCVLHLSAFVQAASYNRTPAQMPNLCGSKNDTLCSLNDQPLVVPLPYSDLIMPSWCVTIDWKLVFVSYFSLVCFLMCFHFRFRAFVLLKYYVIGLLIDVFYSCKFVLSLFWCRCALLYLLCVKCFHVFVDFTQFAIWDCDNLIGSVKTTGEICHAFPYYLCTVRFSPAFDFFYFSMFIGALISIVYFYYHLFFELYSRIVTRFWDFPPVRILIGLYTRAQIDIHNQAFYSTQLINEFVPLGRRPGLFKLIQWFQLIFMSALFNMAIKECIFVHYDIFVMLIRKSEIICLSPAASFEPIFFPIYEVVPLMPPRYLVPRDRRKDVMKFTIAKERDYFTRDFDFDKNSLSYGVGHAKSVKFYGKTVLDGKVFSFPSHANRKSFIAFILWMEENVDYNDRARFIIEGICTPTIFAAYSKFYNPLRADRQFAKVVEGLSPELRNVEWACLALGVAFHCYNKDYASLAILLGSHVTLATKLTEALGLKSISDLTTFLSDIFKKRVDRSISFRDTPLDDTLRHWLFSDDEDEEAVEYSGEEKDDLSVGGEEVIGLSPLAMVSLLPVHIKKSPLITKLVTLVTVVACAGFTTNLLFVPNLLKGMDFQSITEKAFCAVLLIQVLTMVWKGLVSYSNTGSFWDLLGVPPETAFIRESSKLLYALDEPLTESQVRENIAKAQELIRSRDYLVGTNAAIDRTVVELHKYIKTKCEFLIALAPRVEPIIIFLKGQPGTGKTTLIEALISYLNARDKVAAFPGERIEYNLYDKFPVESGAHCSARFLILNDIADDYTDFPKRDLAPLEITLQKAIDTCTLEFRSAAVEDKGKVFNGIRYVIVTTNHDNYKFSSDATKLKRRFASGIFADVDFAVGEFADSEKLTDRERNASIQITMMVPTIKAKYMSLTRTMTFYSYVGFFKIVAEKVEAHFTRAEERRKKLFAAGSVCKCGVPILMHYSDDKYIDPKLDASNRPRINPVWNRIDESCEPPVETLVPYVPRTVELHSAPSVIPLSPVFVFATGFVLPFLYPWMKPTIDLLITTYEIAKRFGFEIALASYIRVGRVHNEMMRMSGQRSTIMSYAYEAQYRAIEFSVALCKFVSKYSKPIAIFLGSVAVGSFLLSYFKKTDVPLGGGMSRYTVDEASMQTSVIGQAQHYAPSSLRTWARTDPVVHFEVVSKGVGRDNLITLCMNAMATASFTIHIGNKMATFSPRVVFLSPDYVAVNKHYTQDEKGDSVSHFTVTIDGITCHVDYKDLISVPNSELVLIRNIWRPSTANLMSKFANHEHQRGGLMDLVVLYPDRGNFITPGFCTETTLYGVTYPSIMWNEQGNRGDCGTLALSHVKGDWFIAGIVAFGEVSRGSVVSVGITCVNSSDFPSSVAMGYPLVEEFIVPGLPRTLQTLSSNSEFVQQPNKYMMPYGTAVGGTNHFKSQIKKTKLYDEVAPKLSEPYSYPDRISRTVTKDDGTREYLSAWRSTFKNVDLPNLSKQSTRYLAMSSYVDDCMRAVEGKKVELHPLSLFEAFWGHEALKIDGVVMKTSLGVTWREQGFRDKHDLFKKNDQTGKFEALPEFVQSVEKIIDDLRKGIVHAPLVDFVPKDEVRPQSKIDACKIRLFSVLDFDINAVFRMFAMPIINFLLDNPEFSECYGGMNAGSIQWTDLARRLQRFGFFTDFDFSTFDVSHDVIMLTLVAHFFFCISLRLGYTKEEARLTFLIVRSLSFQLMKYMCDYFGKIKGMPSGVIITLILNSVVNSMLMRMAFIELISEIPVSKFTEHVAAATVGDDNVSGISSAVIDRFNPIVIKPLYESWGYTITPASKGDEFQKHIPFEKLIFLKRRFVLWSDGWYRAPLERDSLYKALAFQGSSSLSMSARLVSVYDSMVREAYLHGEDFFNEYYGWIRALFIKHRLAAGPGEEVHDGMAKPYYFEDLDEIFKNNAFSTFMC